MFSTLHLTRFMKPSWNMEILNVLLPCTSFYISLVSFINFSYFTTLSSLPCHPSLNFPTFLPDLQISFSYPFPHIYPHICHVSSHSRHFILLALFVVSSYSLSLTPNLSFLLLQSSSLSLFVTLCRHLSLSQLGTEKKKIK